MRSALALVAVLVGMLLVLLTIEHYRPRYSPPPLTPTPIVPTPAPGEVSLWFPPEWSRIDRSEFFRKGYSRYGVWTNGEARLVLSSSTTAETLGELKMAQKLAKHHDKVHDAGIITICSGKQKAGAASFERATPQRSAGYWSVEVVPIPAQSIEYMAAYFSPAGNAPDPATTVAMRAMCVSP